MEDAFALTLSVLTLAQFWAFGFRLREIGFAYAAAVASIWIVYCVVTHQPGLQVLNVGSVTLNLIQAYRYRST